MVPLAIRREVERRANRRCEYCGFPSAFAEARFHVDHVIAEQHGGRTHVDNLAFACFPCNVYKGPNLSSVDPISGNVVRLFHPRRDRWLDHFEWNGARITGRTPVGRATVALLRMNDLYAVAARQSLMEEGVFFPSRQDLPG